jgi:CheY-like chemotaxis protein
MGDETPAVKRAPRLDGLHILVVEDDPDGRELMSTVIGRAGARATTVASVRAALEALESLQPDALLSDIGLPREDGYALIREVRAREAERGGFLPAVALTGYVREEERAHVLAAGFQMHIPKPVDLAELIAAIATVTKHSRGR